MNILGINPGHNGSVALLIDGKLEFYIEEERLSRSKYDGNPFMGILEGLKHGIDVLALGGTSNDLPQLPWTGEDPYTALVRKHSPNVKVMKAGHAHHVGHAASAFYNSGFEEGIKSIFRSFGGNPDTQRVVGDDIEMDSAITIVKAYEAVSEYLGFGYIEAGKTMGLAPYGENDDLIPSLFINGRGNKNMFLPNYPAGAHIDYTRHSYLIPQVS